MFNNQSAMNSLDVATRAKAQMKTTSDPLERLRNALLMRGAAGIKEFARYCSPRETRKDTSLIQGLSNRRR